ncbi:transcriptional regulator GfcR [Natronosalvus rutilus]|uniref:Transcriptional regulator GfcR n=1 Tax=Natronosalvus rutilus TaxID=2953753 RepID=A0A9E7STT2_9EURY|nr:transcriptional regulator GfcR [Natronosalvus rutilus]UTF52855.1 orotate phosphoribosyltransferase-like protein [Natronosalvus rutilus]
MKNVDDLIESAADLAERGLSKGEIADELNVSRETASWLVERSGTAPQPSAPETADTAGSADIHVDWSAIGRDSKRMGYVASAMADLLAKHGEDVDLTIGIEKAGGPIAALVAHKLETDLGTYTPAKHQWEEGDIDELGGTFSRNFATIRGRECYVVDDTVTSGTTMRETIEAIRKEGGEPLACVVLADKQGVDELDGVPVYSLLQVISVGKEADDYQS